MSSIKCDQGRVSVDHEADDDSAGANEMTWHELPESSKSTTDVVVSLARLHFDRGRRVDLANYVTDPSCDPELVDDVAQSAWDRWDQ